MIDRREAVQRMSLLLGGTLSTQLTAGLMGQVLNEGTSVAVTEAMQALLAEVAEVIIPETDTPGAKEAGAEQFIIRVMRDCYELAPQQKFYSGLDKVNLDSQEQYQKNFIDLNAEEKIAIITLTQKTNQDFFRQMVQMTKVGYFTSEIGATQTLEYLPVPGKFEGDVPYEKGQKAWAIPR